MPPIELRGPRNTITVEMAAKGSVDVGVALLASVAPAILTGVFLTTGAPATATATVHAPEVSYGATVETGGPATATATVYAPDVSYGAEVTTGAPATATATVYAPDVAVSAGVVTGPPATATATVYAPTVSYGQAITTGAPATAIATVYAPEVDAGVAVSVTSGAPAAAVATVYAPEVSYGQSLTTGAPATATATVYAPTVAAGASFTPADLFAASEVGVWYDPSDLTSMNTLSDGTGTQPAVGDPVGRLEDKSGNANHALQATAANRPILRQTAGGKYYLEFDGVNDFMDSPVYQVANTGVAGCAAFSVNSTISNDDYIMSADLVSGGFRVSQILRVIGEPLATTVFLDSGGNRSISIPSVISASTAYVGTSIAQTGNLALRLDGAEIGSRTDVTAISTVSSAVRLMGGSTERASGDFYGGAVIDRSLTTTEIDNLETHLADKAGVTL